MQLYYKGRPNEQHTIMKISSDRSILLVKNILASFFIKGWSALVVLMMVPLTLNCLGAYKNGVWLTISSMLVWIDQMDIGLGNGLRNSLATHVAHDDYTAARKVVSSTMAMSFCIMVPILLGLLYVIWNCNIYSFLNVNEAEIPELRIAAICAVTLVCMTFVMKNVGNVYMGMQIPAANNLIMALGQTLALISTWLLYISQNASFIHIVLANTATPLFVYLLAFPYTFYGKFPELRPRLSEIDLHAAIQLGNISLKFFWLQIAAVVQFMTANILISRFFNPEMVTKYQIAYRYMSIVMVFFTVVCMPFWNATTDAYERNDMNWICRASRKMNMLTLLIFFLLVTMTIVSPLVYDFWIDNSCHVPFSMTVMMAIYIFLLIVSMRYSYFLNGIGALRLQMYMTVSAIVFIPLAWYVSKTSHNIIWFMAAMCICNIPGIIVNVIQFNKILKGKAVGIWRK